MAKRKNRWQKAQVVFQPDTYKGWQKGIDQIVDAIVPTLGPIPRIVMYDKTIGKTGRLPELLDDGGTIARRIIQIADRDADVAAMLTRHMLWELHEKVGDGTATAAVIFREIYNEGVRYLAAGGNAMRLRGYLQEGLRLIVDELSTMVTHLEGKHALSRLAYSICYDDDLAKMLGEIFDIIGEYGRLELRNSHSRYMDREYVEGMYWEGGLLSRTMINNQERQRAELENPVILMTNLEIDDPKDLIPVLGMCVHSGIDGVLVIARKISEAVIGLLQINKKQQRIKVDVVGAKTPGVAADAQRTALEDLAVLTGGQPLLKEMGAKLRNVKAQQLGRARRVWVDKTNVGIIGAKGNPRALRQYIAGLRQRYANITDLDDREKLQKRIGILMGGSATLWIPGMTKTELDYNKELAKRTSAAMRGAMREGVVPGGGVALRACRERLEQQRDQSEDLEARAAYQILIHALSAPLRTLVQNAGYEPGQVLADIESAGPGYGFDVKANKIVNMADAGIFDAAAVTRAAIHSAVSTAALALTTDVVVHRPNAPDALNT